MKKFYCVEILEFGENQKTVKINEVTADEMPDDIYLHNKLCVLEKCYFNTFERAKKFAEYNK